MAKFCPWFPALTCNVFWGRSCSAINWTLLTFLHASNDLPSLDRYFHVWCRNPLTIKANTINWNRLACCPRLRSSSCYSPRNNWWKARNHLYVWGHYCSRDLCFPNCWLFCPLKKVFSTGRYWIFNNYYWIYPCSSRFPRPRRRYANCCFIW